MRFFFLSFILLLIFITVNYFHRDHNPRSSNRSNHRRSSNRMEDSRHICVSSPLVRFFFFFFFFLFTNFYFRYTNSAPQPAPGSSSNHSSSNHCNHCRSRSAHITAIIITTSRTLSYSCSSNHTWWPSVYLNSHS